MDAVMKETDGNVLHNLGRQIKNYNDDIWKKMRKNISYIGNKNKFMNNKELYGILVKTDMTKLIYLSDDEIWGCGKSNNGENLLGCILMEIRYNEMITMSRALLSQDEELIQYFSRNKSIYENADCINFCKINNIP